MQINENAEWALLSSANGGGGMAANDAINQFIRDALLAGRSREDIRDVLGQAEWSDNEINNALAEFSEIEFSPPVPRPRPQLTARDAFIYAILFTALAFAAVYLINLVNAILDIKLRDPGDHQYFQRYAISRLRWSIAILLVSMPVYIWMTYYTSRRIEKDETYRRSLVRKWLTYVALFVAAGAFFGDATYVIYELLKGETTLRFLLKAATVAIVSIAVIAFYLRDVEDLKGGP